MPILERGQSSSPANPALDLFTTLNGIRTDVSSLEFQIFEKVSNPDVPVQVYPTTPGVRAQPNFTVLAPTGDKLTTGHYVARWTVPNSQVLGTHEIRWFYRVLSELPEQLFREEFVVLSVGASAGAGADPPPPDPVVSGSELSLATIDLVDLTGRPVVGQRIAFFHTELPSKIETFWGAAGREPIEAVTNEAGHAEIALLRGKRTKVVFVGTPVVREILVPDQATFELLGAISTSSDPFDIKDINVPAAPRRTV